MRCLQVNNWNRFNANSGGTLVEKCCHFFDLMCLIVGAKPRRVMASGAQDVNHLDEVYDGKVRLMSWRTYERTDGVQGAPDITSECWWRTGCDPPG